MVTSFWALEHVFNPAMNCYQMYPLYVGQKQSWGNKPKLGFHPDSRGCWASCTLHFPSSVIPAHVPCELWLGSKQSDQQQPSLWCHFLEQQLCSPSFCRWEEVVRKPHSPTPALRLEETCVGWKSLAGKCRGRNIFHKKQPSLKARHSCNFSFLTHNPNPIQHIQQLCEWLVNAKCFHHHYHNHHHVNTVADIYRLIYTSGKQCVTCH